jgi:hypothetical protein
MHPAPAVPRGPGPGRCSIRNTIVDTHCLTHPVTVSAISAHRWAWGLKVNKSSLGVGEIILEHTGGNRGQARHPSSWSRGSSPPVVLQHAPTCGEATGGWQTSSLLKSSRGPHSPAREPHLMEQKNLHPPRSCARCTRPSKSVSSGSASPFVAPHAASTNDPKLDARLSTSAADRPMAATCRSRGTTHSPPQSCHLPEGGKLRRNSRDSGPTDALPAATST